MKSTWGPLASLSLVVFTAGTLHASTYYLQSMGGTAGSPPFPNDPYEGAEPITTIEAAREIYRVDDNTNDWEMLTTAKQLDAMSASSTTMTASDSTSPPSPGGTNTSGGTNYTVNALSNPIVIGSNDLWLQIISVTNDIANLVIHPPCNVTNGVYELYYCTNLTSPIAWQWLLRSQPGQTNLIVPNATDTQGFYRLGSPDDITANDSLGTNFWVAFFDMVNNGPNMSLYISSPVGTTGTVTFPPVLTNGPLLSVTNCGDLGLNGTYVLTNLTAQEQTDWPNNVLDATDVGYVNGTNWIDFGDDGEVVWLFAYDSNLDVCTFLYWTPTANFNGRDTNWYMWYYDTNSPPPTTECPQITVNPSVAFTVPPGAVTNISVSPGLMMTDYDTVETNGIHITTSQPVAIYGAEYSLYSSSSFTVYPVPLLGTNYCLMARASMDGYYYDDSEFGVVATEDNTIVTITPSATANLTGNTYSVELQQGETYQIQTLANTNDLTGTRVTSDKPVGVFAGANYAFVPSGNYGYDNPLMQEQLPIENWGMQALSMGFARQTNGDSYRVLAAYDNTTLIVTGAVVTIVSNGLPSTGPTVTITNETVTTNLMAGQFYDIIVAGSVEFQGSQPIQVAHFLNGAAFDNIGNVEGDPCEILLPPTGYYLLTNIVYTLPGAFDENYLNIIAAQSAITNTFVDGSVLAATNFVAIGTSGYYGARIPLVNNGGTHTVISSQPVGVEVYGFGVADAYGYFGGVVK
jgi:hypothetical protein